ncbi:MAG: LysM peptidoglycan-binding domain-containing M23 family metallopeptidase [Trueperaceae bacterium]|nr:LysM peptidoglycan-binding domain-containing M23 family metallopeptidase [Trueperaceae bacterium]
MRIGLRRALIALACIAPGPVFGQGGVHVVEPGDTLYELASRYDTTVTALRETNALVGDVLRVGTRLELPGPAGWSWRTVPNDVSWPELARDLELPETLLRDANPQLTRPGGAEVRVPPGEGPLATPRDGEDLIAFAARLGVPPGTLAVRNGLEPPYPVEAGVPLLVPIADRAPVGLGGAVDASLDVSVGSPIDSPIAPATVSHAELRIPALASLAEILERRPLTPPDDDFAWPLAGAPRITSRFGWRNVSVGGNRYHVGLDLGAPTGTPVLAVLDGTVLRAGWFGAYGYAVYVGHADGFETRYAHLSSIAVEPGQRVSRGTALGRVGSTGASTGPHLHFEVRQAGRALDPLGVLPDRARGASTSR